MFEIGDKVVCIDRGKNQNLIVNKIYIIDNVIFLSFIRYIVISDHIYNTSLFITLEEDRRRKLKNLMNKLC